MEVFGYRKLIREKQDSCRDCRTHINHQQNKLTLNSKL